MRYAVPAPHNGRRPAGGNLRFRANARKFRHYAKDRPQNAPLDGARKTVKPIFTPFYFRGEKNSVAERHNPKYRVK